MDPLKQYDTLVISAGKSNFENQFIGEEAWYFIRIHERMIDKIKYIAAYQNSPISAITHFAQVKKIEPDSGTEKRKVYFSSSPKKLVAPIPLANSPVGTIQGPRYTTFNELRSAKKVSDLFG